MKSINFIDPVPPQKQKALLLWLGGSAVVLVLFLVVAAFAHMNHVRVAHTIEQDLKDLKQQTIEFEMIAQRKKQLEEDKKRSEDRLISLRSLAQMSDAPYSLLLMLSSLIPPQVCLTRCHAYPGKMVELEGVAQDPKAVAQFVEALSSCHLFQEVRLTSLVTSEKEHEPAMQFLVEGIWASDEQHLIQKPGAI